MFNVNNLESELTKAKELITRSKNTIIGLQALVKTREAEISDHIAALDNAAKITDSVSSIATKFQENFKDFETFLSNISNTNTQFVDYPAETENKTKTAPNVQIVDENFKVSPKIDAGSIHIGPLVKE